MKVENMNTEKYWAPAQAECFSNVNQDFLICTTIHKARQLGVFTGDTYVRISLGKAHKSSKVFSNSENPYYNEYLVFELKCTLNELLRLTILYEVRKRTPCKKDLVLGELLIDLQSVWNQPNRCFFKKWGHLETPIGSNSNMEGKGYLQIDLAIVSQAANIGALYSGAGVQTAAPSAGPVSGGRSGGANADSTHGGFGMDMDSLSQWQLNTNYDDIDKNLLQNIDSATQCNIRYSIFFCRGFFVKKADYQIQFRLHPFKGKTRVCKSTTSPAWNQEITFAWNYPSLAQTFLIQVMMHEHLCWRPVAEAELHFDEIAFKETPFLGPTYLHLYDPLHPAQYIGRLLVEVRSECMTTNLSRELLTKDATPIDEQHWWQNELFHIEFLALHGDFVHGNLSNMKISLKLAEHSSNTVECYLKSYSSKYKASKNIKHFKHDAPFKAIYLKTDLPDNRHKFDSDIFMQEILDYMKNEIETFKMFQLKYTNQFQLQAKCFKAVLLAILCRIKEGVEHKKLEYASFKDPTTWDTNRSAYLQDFYSKLPDELRGMRQRLKSANSLYIETTIEEVLQELIKLSQDMTGILAMTRIQDEWPDLLISLSVGSNKDFAVCKLNAKYFLKPPREKEANPSTLCWRLRNFVFKDIQCSHTCVNCGCTVGTIQGCLSIIADSERNDYIATIVQDWKQTENFYWTPSIPYTVFKCRMFIHQAKVRPGNDRTGLCDAHLRVICGGQSAETHTEKATLSPIWNVVVCFEGIVMPGSVYWYMMNPPLIAVEIYDTDKLTADDYLGCGVLAASVISADKLDSQRDEPESARKRGLTDFTRIVKTKQAVQKYVQLKSLSPPPLKWVPMAMNGGVRAEVLMAAEFVEMQNESNNTVAPEPTITHGIPNGIRPIMRNYVLEVVFAGFRNYTKGGRHRVKIMMGDLLLTSGLSSSRIKNSINFLVLYASGVVSLPEQLEYWPAIIATDVLVSHRGAETTVGAVLISNCKRFLQREKKTKCLPSTEPEFESSVASTTVHFEDDEESPLIAKESMRTKLSKRFKSVVKMLKPSPKIMNPLTKDNDNDTCNIVNETEFSWWTKFYNSLYHDSTDDSRNFKHILVIYGRELEKQAEFSYMHDWAEPVKLVHGVKYKKNALPKEESYATLKLQIKLSQCQCNSDVDCDGGMLKPLAAALNPKFQSQLQSLAETSKLLVRVYVVQGIQFRPHDKHNQSDSYVKLQLGSKMICNRAHYVQNQSNPIFGKCFQLEGVIPRDHILEVSVFDRNCLCDEVIGSTYIDLEDRWRTKHRATVGIANEYSKTGYNKWRDMFTPHEILLELCKKNDVKLPSFLGDTIEVDGVLFRDETEIATEEDLQERLSLTVLKNLEKLPSFGYRLVPEHVETRPLFRSDCPGIEQGKIQLWIELYEGNLNIPPAIDITPQPPQLYELRVTIFDCTDIILSEKNIFGKRMTDIYVKGWCQDSELAQTTDIHYRSLDGEGAFNWRMIFPLKYSVIEDMMVVKRKGGILEEYETKQPPVLNLQIWDNDILMQDDFLGSLEINLSNFPQPFDSSAACTLPEDSGNAFAMPFGGRVHRNKRKPINLFRTKIIKGWFPMRGSVHNKSVSNNTINMLATALRGKIHLELEIVSDAEASSNPVGLGRDPPGALPEPLRPETSFNPLLHPLKGLSKIVFPAFRKFVCYLLLVAILVTIIAAFFMRIPTFFIP